MALNNFKCYHLMPLHFKGLIRDLMFAITTDVYDLRISALTVIKRQRKLRFPIFEVHFVSPDARRCDCGWIVVGIRFLSIWTRLFNGA